MIKGVGGQRSMLVSREIGKHVASTREMVITGSGN